MPTRVSLRKTLRSIPILRDLPKQTMDAVVASLQVKKYKPGDRLWRPGVRLNFLGIVQEGEIMVEYYVNGTAKHCTRLGAGSFLEPYRMGRTGFPVSTSAFASTEVNLYILSLEQLAQLQLVRQSAKSLSTPARVYSVPYLTWNQSWLLITAMILLLVVWSDITGVVSGVLYLVSEQIQPAIGDQETLKLLGYAEKLAPHRSYIQNRQGHIWMEFGERQLAATAFSASLSSDTKDQEALNNLAVLMFISGSLDQSILLQQRAVQSDPNIAIIRYNLGLMLLEQKDYSNAIQALTEATRINPGWAPPYTQLSFAFLQELDFPAAEQAARTAIRLAPNLQAPHLCLAIALYNQERAQEALPFIERAVEIGPDQLIARFYKAVILSGLRDYDQALSILRELQAETTDLQIKARISIEIERLLRLSAPTSLPGNH
jgi:tetratricopeptide (TPR) repeat protein